jgi:hypothetical protein
LNIQVFIDDSGTLGRQGTLVFAGFFAEREAWASMADEWNACLQVAPSIRLFKFKDADN